MKKIIFHLITHLELGGCEKMLSKTIPLFKKHTPIVICLRSEGVLSEGLRKNGVLVYHLNVKSFFDLKAIFAFRRLIHQYKPYVLVTYLPHADVFGRIWGKIFKIPVILKSIRSCLLPGWKFYLLCVFERCTSSWVDTYISVSETAKKSYIQRAKIPPSKIKVIPNGIDLKLFQNPVNIQKKRKALRIPSDAFILLYVAKLRIQEKNHFFLLKIFKTFLKDHPSSYLLLAGDGADRTLVENYIHLHHLKKNVLLLGDRNDVPELLKMTDVFLLPSFSEGMSNALLEAMATGCCIMASDIPANRELISSQEGFLLRLDSPQVWMDTLSMLYLNPLKKQEKQKAAQRKSFNFDIQKISQALDAFYSEF
ncbi:MAG: glycosyltransferase [Candidatus Gracilibacteria bacterium]